MANTSKTGGRTTPPKNREQGAPTEASSASAWKKSASVEGTLVTVPSGNVVRMRTPGMQAFLKQGSIPNALIPFVKDMMSQGPKQSDKPKGKPGQTEDQLDDEMIGKLLDDPEKLAAIFDLADQVTIDCVIEPDVQDVPRDAAGDIIAMGDERRDDEVVYVDEMDFNDKMFIFNVAVGGPASLEKFRQGPGAALERVSER